MLSPPRSCALFQAIVLYKIARPFLTNIQNSSKDLIECDVYHRKVNYVQGWRRGCDLREGWRRGPGNERTRITSYHQKQKVSYETHLDNQVNFKIRKSRVVSVYLVLWS